MHTYHETHGTLPPPAVFGKGGRPLLSWRVLILPFIEEENLFKKFRLDEPWDSPHNLALLPEMPRMFGRYDDRTTKEPFTTFYQVFVGKGTAFEGPRGLKLSENFPDGTGNTILVIEAGVAVPWTKPEDLHYAKDEPLPKLGGLYKDTFRVAFVDSRSARSNERRAKRPFAPPLPATVGRRLTWTGEGASGPGRTMGRIS